MSHCHSTTHLRLYILHFVCNWVFQYFNFLNKNLLIYFQNFLKTKITCRNCPYGGSLKRNVLVPRQDSNSRFPSSSWHCALQFSPWTFLAFVPTKSLQFTGINGHQKSNSTFQKAQRCHQERASPFIFLSFCFRRPRHRNGQHFTSSFQSFFICSSQHRRSWPFHLQVFPKAASPFHLYIHMSLFFILLLLLLLCFVIFRSTY